MKNFTQGHRKDLRFSREIKALRRLSGIDGVPALLAYSPAERWLAIDLIPGTPLPENPAAPDKLFTNLRVVVENMLRCGVARHSLPARDVIVRPDGTAGVVDFERCTLQHWRFSPIWWVARKVTQFHLLRLIDNHAPHLLTPKEQLRLQTCYRLSKAFHRCTRWRSRLRHYYRSQP
ncbi:hypothetical protein ERE07_18260 [Allopusillimonas ginsengisoli]|nr:hypothetical protein ERE07_18260 [Allopusillimonas ginsengisoli]